MKLGLITKHTNLVDAVWRRLPPVARWALIGKYGARAPGLVTLGDLR
jgi:hypothetical protein